MKTTKIILANPPFVSESATGIFMGTDELSLYMEAKRGLRNRLGDWKANDMFPKHFAVQHGVRAGSRWPHYRPDFNDLYTPFPFLLAYASSNLRENGFDSKVVDCVLNRQFSYERFIEELRYERSDIVVVETSLTSEEIDLWLCRRISEFAEVALAGPHVTDTNIDSLRKANPRVSYFLKGEYILSVVEMAKTRRPGVYESTVVKDLDSVPFPDRSFLGADKVHDAWLPGVEWPQLQVWGSKGCPFKCTFCLWPHNLYKGTVSLRRPERIVQEIREAVEMYGYRHVYFDDDTFNVGNERISKLCDLMKKLGVPWGIMARIDTSPLDLFDKMIDCGCVGMKFGLESFDAKVLASINKKLDPGELFHKISYLTQQYPKIRFHLTTMREIPGQSEEIHQLDMTILRSLGFMDENNPYRSYQLSTCIPFPGTALYDEMTRRA